MRPLEAADAVGLTNAAAAVVWPEDTRPCTLLKTSRPEEEGVGGRPAPPADREGARWIWSATSSSRLWRAMASRSFFDMNLGCATREQGREGREDVTRQQAPRRRDLF
jgi:hypothetical protein